MDFEFTSEDQAFRTEARAWLTAHAEPVQDRRTWERTLGKAGWIGLGWPEGGYGNRTAGLTQQVAWAEEYARSGAPPRSGHIGENLLAPTLIAHGTDEQKSRFLPPIAAGEELWCQGYSEPGAGSDLAGVRTSAVREGRPTGSVARRSGPRSRMRPTGALCWPVPIPAPVAITASAFCSCPWTSRGVSRCGPSVR